MIRRIGAELRYRRSMRVARRVTAGRSIAVDATGPAKTCTNASLRGRKEQISGAIRVLPLTGISRPRHQTKQAFDFGRVEDSRQRLLFKTGAGRRLHSALRLWHGVRLRRRRKADDPRERGARGGREARLAIGHQLLDGFVHASRLPLRRL